MPSGSAWGGPALSLSFCPQRWAFALQPQLYLHLQAFDDTVPSAQEAYSHAMTALELLHILQSPHFHAHTFLEPLIFLCLPSKVLSPLGTLVPLTAIPRGQASVVRCSPNSLGTPNQ